MLDVLLDADQDTEVKKIPVYLVWLRIATGKEEHQS